ncbi:MAG TPA: sigma-70 family RNA polymerase sigma factor, partial [Draconibacterium sp.]|nr:sigma-70 family RNA polymerase sigma factor [Draconibacterium sp.]
KSKFSTWFMRIVINEAYKIVQRNKVTYSNELVELEEVAKDGIIEAEQKFFVNKVLNLMLPNESLVLRLFYLNEYNINEICEMTGWDKSKVKVTLHRARKSMESKMKNLLNTEVESLI